VAKPKESKQVKLLDINDLKAQIDTVQKAVKKLNDLSTTATSPTVKGDIQQALALRAAQLEQLQRQETLLVEIAEIERYRDIDAKNILTNEEKDQYTKQANDLRDQLGNSSVGPPANTSLAPLATSAGPRRGENTNVSNAPGSKDPARAAGGSVADDSKPQTLQEPGGEFTRAIIGYEQAGASAAAKRQNVFIDLYFGSPLSDKKFLFFGTSTRDFDFGPRWRSWGDIRVSSVPLQNTAGNISVSNFVNGGFAQQVGSLKVNEVVQGVEFLAGAEVLLGGIRRPLPSFAAATKEKFSFSFFLGGGAITPVTPLDSRQLFVATPEAINSLNLTSTTQFIAFVNPDRDRFFRQYYAGIRLKTHYFQNCDTNNAVTEAMKKFDVHCLNDYGSIERLRQVNRFPAMLDIAVGQNESVTKGRLNGALLRVDGFFPLPWEKGQSVYLFGTALMKPRRASINTPLVLAPAPDTTPVPGPNVAIVPIDQIDRDYYRIGVGVDVIGLIKTFVKTTPNTPSNQAPKLGAPSNRTTSK